MRVLLIWEVIPEGAEAYLIEDPTQEQLDMLLAANEKYVNGGETDKAALTIGATLLDEKDAFPDVAKKWLGIWKECRVEFPVKGPIDLVVVSGFYL